MAKEWLVIDAHIHYLSPEAATKTGTGDSFDHSTVMHGELSIPMQRMQNIEGMLRLMEDSGIDMLLLNFAAWSLHGLEWCKALNNGYARIGRQYPGKFILCGQVPLQRGKDVVDEIERCINELGFKGMALVSSLSNVTLDSPDLWLIYEKISQLGVPIVVHPSSRFPLWGGGEKYDLRRTLSREYDIAKATVEVMYGVLKDFPDLKFLMPHYGGGIPSQKARLRAWFEPDNVIIPTEIKSCGKTPRELDELGISKAFDEIFDKLYFDMAGAGAGWIPTIESALLLMRTDRLCFGTDYPFDVHNAQDIRSFIDVIKQLNIPEADRRLILGENVKKLFKV